MTEHLNSLDILPIEDNGLTSSLILYSPELCILSSRLLNQFVSLRTPFHQALPPMCYIDNLFLHTSIVFSFSAPTPASRRRLLSQGEQREGQGPMCDVTAGWAPSC